MKKKFELSDEEVMELEEKENNCQEKDTSEEQINETDIEELETEDYSYLSSARSISLLKQASLALEEVRKGVELNQPIDMVEIDLKNVWELLGEITGDTYSEELIDQLFSQFCLGK